MFGALGDVAYAGIAEHERQGFVRVDLEDQLRFGAALRPIGVFLPVHAVGPAQIESVSDNSSAASLLYLR